MLYVNVTYTLPAQNRDKFIQEIISENIPELTRQEPGNHAYDFSVPIECDNQVYLREAWEEEFFDDHKASPNIKKLGAMKEKYSITTTITFSKSDE